MKKLLTITLLALAGLIFTNFVCFNSAEISSTDLVADIDIPENVKSLLDQSCYGCHNSESQNEKARKKLEFDQMNSLKTFEQIGLLKDIQKVLEEGNMPPEKFLKKYPKASLSKKNMKVLIKWANESAENLAEK